MASQLLTHWLLGTPRSDSTEGTSGTRPIGELFPSCGLSSFKAFWKDMGSGMRAKFEFYMAGRTIGQGWE